MDSPMNNIFPLEPYSGKDSFCDREQEISDITSLLKNGTNTVLISPRRYGKTGLILRSFDDLKQNKYTCIYADIFSAKDMHSLVKILSEAVVSSISEDSLIKNFFDTIKAVRPLLSFDPISGTPQVTFNFQADSQKQETLKNIFDFLENQPQKIIFAIDEFQQIRNFKDDNVEAVLRTYIQHLHNVKFIFCGSKKHMMLDMFTSAASPFYESACSIHLDKIPAEKYAPFIKEQFKKGGQDIDEESISFILEWTKRHTYYTQLLCNRIFAESHKKIDLATTKSVAAKILRLQAQDFIEKRNLITDNQWDFLQAVAKEGCVKQPTAAAFLQKYKLGNASSAKKITTALVEKELLLEATTLEGKSYSVYNVFMSRWMEGLV